MNTNRIKKILLIIAIIIAVVFVASICYIKHLDKPLKPSNKDTQLVKVEEGSTTTDIGNLLKEKKIISSSGDFKILSKIKKFDGHYQAGTYALSPSMTPSEIATIIISGDTSMVTITIPEGYTASQISKYLADKGIVNKEKFDYVLMSGDFDYDFLKDATNGVNKLNGFLFPDTYTFPIGSSEESIINMMLAQFDKVFDKKMREEAKKQGKSIKEIVTVASIVEREAKEDSERPKVASVVYNRLKKGMKLEMCSCVQFAQGKTKSVLTYEDTKIDSPYNTYIHKGLPPGPICNPGKASIEAALNPEKTDYLYFVVSDKQDGTMKFSKDYDEFLKNKDKYYDTLEE